MVEDLVKRALRMGYLEKGGSVSVTVSGGNSHWQKKLERDLEETILMNTRARFRYMQGRTCRIRTQPHPKIEMMTGTTTTTGTIDPGRNLHGLG